VEAAGVLHVRFTQSGAPAEPLSHPRAFALAWGKPIDADDNAIAEGWVSFLLWLLGVDTTPSVDIREPWSLDAGCVETAWLRNHGLRNHGLWMPYWLGFDPETAQRVDSDPAYLADVTVDEFVMGGIGHIALSNHGRAGAAPPISVRVYLPRRIDTLPPLPSGMWGVPDVPPQLNQALIFTADDEIRITLRNRSPEPVALGLRATGRGSR